MAAVTLDQYFKTHVIQFMVRPKHMENGKYLDGGTTLMRIWTTSPGPDATTTKPPEGIYTALSPSEMDIYKLLHDDGQKNTKNGEKCIRYLLGQVHRYLHKLNAVPDRPPRTFPVFLQWAHHDQRDAAARTAIFQLIRKAVDAAYFSDGVRFRIVQDTDPVTAQTGLLQVWNDWDVTDENFKSLVRVHFRLLQRTVAVVTVCDPVDQPAGNAPAEDVQQTAKEVSVYVYRYSKPTTEYCTKPHKADLLRHDTTVVWFPRDIAFSSARIHRIASYYNVTHYIRNTIPEYEALFPNAAFPPDQVQVEEIGTLGIREEVPHILCKHLSRTLQYGVVMDAGSSKTQSFIYKWQRRFDANCCPTLAESMVSLSFDHSIKIPGIASADVEPGDTMRQYMQELINAIKLKLGALGVQGTGNPAAADHVAEPDGMGQLCVVHMSRIPLYMLATGGMRKLREDNPQQYIQRRDGLATILNQSGFLESKYDTISGAEEGILAWLDTNFEKHQFVRGSKPHGLVEMGGETVQIAFARLSSERVLNNNPWGDYRGPLTTVDLGHGLVYSVFTKTWNGQGAQAKWDEHVRRMREVASEGAPPAHPDPCVPRGGSFTVDGGAARLRGTGNFLDAMREGFDLLGCKDTACGVGDMCVERLKRGCLLKEVDGLVFSPESDQVFIGVSSVKRALSNLQLRHSNVATFYRTALARYSQTYEELSADMNEQQKDFFQREMFTAVWVLTILYLGFGIPMRPYEAGCMKLALIWYRVEGQCRDAAVSPTATLKLRLHEAAKAFFLQESLGQGWLDTIMDAIFNKYFHGQNYREAGNTTIQPLLAGNIAGLVNGQDHLATGLATRVYAALTDFHAQMQHASFNTAYCTWDGNTARINDHFRVACFEFFSACLDIDGQDDHPQFGARLETNDAGNAETWTRGQMLLHSVGTGTKTQSYDGWKK